jgi:acetyl-CoA/propionyl-CoA carboxylase biotin carboxyl carrier protein
MLAKLIVTGADREEALERSRRALDELAVEGLTTVTSFHRAAVRDPAFTAAGPAGFTVHTRWIETEYHPPAGQPSPQPPAEHVAGVTIGGRRMAVRLPGLATLSPAASALAARGLEPRGLGQGALGGDGDTPRTAGRRGNAVTAPMQGTVTKVAAEEGQPVAPGDVIAVVEAMKMENPVTAHRAGTVTGLRVTAGDAVTQDQVICELT